MKAPIRVHITIKFTGKADFKKLERLKKAIVNAYFERINNK